MQYVWNYSCCYYSDTGTTYNCAMTFVTKKWDRLPSKALRLYNGKGFGPKIDEIYSDTTSMCFVKLQWVSYIDIGTEGHR